MLARSSLLVFSFLLLSTACGDDDGPPPTDGGTTDDAATATGAVASFDVPATGAVDWLAIPFPNELYLGGDGTLDIGAPPLDTDLWRSITEKMNLMDGFCRSCAVTFGIDGDLDPASLPADAGLAATASADDAAVLMRLDGMDGLIPVEVDWTTEDNAVTVRAAGLRVLPPSTTYVAALTSDLLAADGTALSPSELFTSVRDEATGPTDEADRARGSVGSGIDALEAAGVARDRIVAVAVFTTRDTGRHLREMAAIVDSAPAPVAVVDRVYSAADGSLDTFLGTPAEDLPGRDNPAAMGTEGTTALQHDAMDMVVLGTFQAPRIVEGTGTEIGFVRRGADGSVEAGPQEDVPFVLVVPAGVDVTNMPVAVAHTGNPGRRAFGLYVGNMLARLGIATLSTDPFTMGARSPAATDVIHNVRNDDGALGPDGLSEYDTGNQQLRFQGVADNAPGLAFHPGYAHGASSQIVSDGMAAIRFLQEGDVSAIAGADAALTGLGFDASQIVWLGLSFGAFTGMSAVTGREGVAAAVFNVGPGALAEVACHGGVRPRLALLLPSAGINGMFDETDRRLCMNPLWNLYRFMLEDAEPQSSLHYLFRAPLHAGAPDVMFQYAGWDENIGATAAQTTLAEAGVPIDNGSFTLADVPAGTAPFNANVETPNGTITAGGWYYPMAGHTALIDRFEESNYEPPVAFPFTERAAPMPFDNPILAVRSQVADFFRTWQMTGQATISAPSAPLP